MIAWRAAAYAALADAVRDSASTRRVEWRTRHYPQRCGDRRNGISREFRAP